MLPDALAIIRRVQQKCSSLTQVSQNVTDLEKRQLMTGNEVGLGDEIGGTDWPRAEAQMRDCHRARFLRVVNKISLCEVIGVFADDLDRLLVGPHRAIGPEAEELRAHHVAWFDGKGRIDIEACASQVIVDPHSEMILRRLLSEILEDCLDHCRRELLRRQTVATANG